MLCLKLDSGCRDNAVAKEQGKHVKMTVTGLGEQYREWKVKVGDVAVEDTRVSKLKENGCFGGNGNKRQQQTRLPFVQKNESGKETGKVISNPHMRKQLSC